MKKILFLILIPVLSTIAQNTIELNGGLVLDVKFKKFTPTTIFFQKMEDSTESKLFVNNIVKVNISGKIFDRNSYDASKCNELINNLDAQKEYAYDMPNKKMINGIYEGQTEEYCEVKFINVGFFTANIKCIVTFGKTVEGSGKDSNWKLRFRSLPDGLNYMNSLGWEFLNAFPVNQSGGYGQVYIFYMKRKVKI